MDKPPLLIETIRSTKNSPFQKYLNFFKMPKKKNRKSIFGRKSSSAKRSHEWRQSQDAKDLRRNEVERQKMSR